MICAMTQWFLFNVDMFSNMIQMQASTSMQPDLIRLPLGK